MARRLKIACLQTRPQPDFNDALSEGLFYAESAANQGAELIALPEYCGGLQMKGPELAPPSALEDEHPVIAGLAKFAQDHAIWLVLGSVAIIENNASDKIKNRGYIIDPQGNIACRYDKIHLFDIDLSTTECYRESARVLPGTKASLIRTPFGIIGHTICYDLRFPALYRDLAQAGAEILMAPSAFTRKTGEAHWHTLNRARAIENGAFVISPCAVGEIEGGGEAYGHSLIIDPWGAVLADGGKAAGIIYSEIDLDDVDKARRRIPSLAHDREYEIRVRDQEALL